MFTAVGMNSLQQNILRSVQIVVDKLHRVHAICTVEHLVWKVAINMCCVFAARSHHLVLLAGSCGGLNERVP